MLWIIATMFYGVSTNFDVFLRGLHEKQLLVYANYNYPPPTNYDSIIAAVKNLFHERVEYMLWIISTMFYGVSTNFDGFLRGLHEKQLLVYANYNHPLNYNATIAAVKNLFHKRVEYMLWINSTMFYGVLTIFDYFTRGVPKWNPPGL